MTLLTASMWQTGQPENPIIIAHALADIPTEILAKDIEGLSTLFLALSWRRNVRD